MFSTMMQLTAAEGTSWERLTVITITPSSLKEMISLLIDNEAKEDLVDKCVFLLKKATDFIELYDDDEDHVMLKFQRTASSKKDVPLFEFKVMDGMDHELIYQSNTPEDAELINLLLDVPQMYEEAKTKLESK